MALQCYVDESSDGNCQHSVVMAGYVASLDNWLKFNDSWDAQLQLRNQNKEYYHTNGGTLTGSLSKKEAEGFYRVIESHIESSFCVTVKVPEYRKLIASCKFPQSLMDDPDFKKLNEPHSLMYQAFFELAIHEKHKLGLSDPIEFIFDETARYRDVITRSFEYMYYSAQELGITKESLGSFPSFKNDKEVSPLQAADLLARIIRTTTQKGEQWDSSKMPWKPKKSIKCLTVELDDKYFLNRFDQVFSPQNYEVYERYYNR